jgi:hypothetical protein
MTRMRKDPTVVKSEQKSKYIQSVALAAAASLPNAVAPLVVNQSHYFCYIAKNNGIK